MKAIYFIWSLFERFGISLVSFAGNLILAYLLTPADFGLVAMLGVFTSLVFVLVDCGLSDGLLRESDPSDRDFNTLFVFNTCTGLALCLLYAALSPLVANFMGNQQLQPVLATLGIGAIFSGMSISQFARLRSRLKFKRVAMIGIGSIVLALTTAIIMALQGCRYWSLVALQVCYPAANVLLLLIFGDWHIRFEFDTARFRQLWKFGVNLLLSTVFAQLAQNIFSFVLGKYYSATNAGYMGQAQKLQQTPVNALEAAISGTSFVLIAKCPTDDEKRRQTLRMLGMMSLANALLCTLMFALCDPIVGFLLPDKWLPVIPYMRLMLCWALAYPVCNFMLIVFKLFDHTAVIRNVMIVEKMLIVVAALLLYRQGIETAILTASSISFLALLVYFADAQRLCGISFLKLLGTYATSTFMAIAAGVAAWAATLPFETNLMQLAAGIPAFAIAALILCRLLRPDYVRYLASKLQSKF